MTTHKPIGILGGTFDPIHFGHLRIALELQQQYDWESVRFVPCQKPVLGKASCATPAQRLQMLQLAIADQPGLTVDERELNRDTPSYSVDTLISLRAEFPETPLCFILGVDLLAELPKWHRWQELLNFAHLVIVQRPGYILPIEGKINNLIQQHLTDDQEQLHQNKAGQIFITQLTPLTISATAIRQQIAAGLSPRYLLPESVWSYIQQKQLYIL